jgi:aryl-alcohol dehydrogenase-like predicted oxidoreductase
LPIHPLRTHRFTRQPALPGHDELRPRNQRSRQLRHHGQGAGTGHQLLRHGQRLWLEKGEGVTENIIGRWFAQGGGRRDKVVLATKVYGGMGDWPNESKLSARHIKQACEGSLRRMQTDYIDLYQMHHVDRNTPWEEIWQAMEQLVREGKILYVGSSNFAGWHIAQANEAAKARHFMGLVAEQSLYNLNARMIELEVIPACQGYGLGLIPWSPLAGGLLGGVLQKIEGRRASERMQKEIEKVRPKLEAWEAFCAELGEQPADVALAWLLSTTRPLPPPSSARAPSTNSPAACAPWKSPSRPNLSPASTKSGPAPAAPPPKPTPGE